MKFYRVALWKAYFDKGFALTNYFKYLIAFYGFSSLNVKYTLVVAGIYGVFCFFFGWWAIRYGFASAEHEIQNQINPFQMEVRRKLFKQAPTEPVVKTCGK